MDTFLESDVQIIPRYDRLYSLYESVGHCLQKSPRFPGVTLKQFHPRLLWQVPLLAAARILHPSHGDPFAADSFYWELEADVFCTFGVQANSARVIAAAHATGRPAVLMIGSDGDLDERYAPDSEYVSQYGDVAPVCYEILQQADAVVVQTPHQQQLLRQRFGREGHVIANPFDLQGWQSRMTSELPAEFCAGLNRYALWVGRAEPIHKRPQLLLDLARRCPDVPFLMILNPRDDVLERKIQATRPGNVHIVPSVPFDLMPALFSRARVFVSTSALEGFPNVFLQAVASRVPIGSLEVGGEFLAASGGGEYAAGNLERLAGFVRRCWDSPETVSRPDPSYLSEHHDLEGQVRQLRGVLIESVERHLRNSEEHILR